MKILHTESSNGWGGQEMRILREAEGMRQRGHELRFAVVQGGRLAHEARKAGFPVLELSFSWGAAPWTVCQLIRYMLIHGIDLVNTHSSRDAWVGGVAARLARARLIRTRHLSTPIRPGVNSRLLYGWLADAVVTTSQKMVPIICRQAHLKSELCRSIPTGVSPLTVSPEEVRKFREGLGLKEGDLLIGTACVVRSWKGIPDFLQSALLLKGDPRLKWVIVGGGHLDQYPLPKELEGVVTFTGHLESPYAAIAAMDVFLLLSTASEGVSQAALQAAYLGRPLVTTDVGGLSEVCLDGRTGILVPPRAPDKVSRAVADLAGDPALRERFGAMGRRLVEERFMLGGMLDQLEELYRLAFR